MEDIESLFQKWRFSKIENQVGTLGSITQIVTDRAELYPGMNFLKGHSLKSVNGITA